MNMNTPASGTDTARPVTDWENRESKGAALVCKYGHDATQKKTAELRQRQEAYERSLPKDAIEAMGEISRNLADTGDYCTPEYAPRAALAIIKELSVNGGLDDSDEMNGAVYWLTTQALDALDGIEGNTIRARHIARQFHPMHKPFQA